MMRWAFCLAIYGLLFCPAVVAQPTTSDEIISDNELDELRAGLLAAFNAQDIDKQLSYLHKDVVVTWQDAVVCRGPDEIREYITRMMEGENRVVEKLDVVPKDIHRHIFGSTSVSHGILVEHFTLTNGMEFELECPCTVTVVKENGKLLIVGFHVSSSAFDNPIIDTIVQKTALWTGGIALAIGVLLGTILTLLVSRMRQRAAG